MISEHKSQGLLQTMHNKDPKEYYWVDEQDTPGAGQAAALLFKQVAPVPAAVTSQ